MKGAEPSDEAVFAERRQLQKNLADRARALTNNDLRRVMPEFYEIVYAVYMARLAYRAEIPHTRLRLPESNEPYDIEKWRGENERVRRVLSTPFADLALSDEELGATPGARESLEEGARLDEVDLRALVEAADGSLPASAADTGVWARQRRAQRRRAAAANEARAYRKRRDIRDISDPEADPGPESGGVGMDEEAPPQRPRSASGGAPAPFAQGGSAWLPPVRGDD